MTEIEPLINIGKALPNITDGNLLRQNDDKCRHEIIILVQVVNDAAPWSAKVLVTASEHCNWQGQAGSIS